MTNQLDFTTRIEGEDDREVVGTRWRVPLFFGAKLGPRERRTIEVIPPHWHQPSNLVVDTPGADSFVIHDLRLGGRSTFGRPIDARAFDASAAATRFDFGLGFTRHLALDVENASGEPLQFAALVFGEEGREMTAHERFVFARSEAILAWLRRWRRGPFAPGAPRWR
jgi:hypothetical protein